MGLATAVLFLTGSLSVRVLAPERFPAPATLPPPPIVVPPPGPILDSSEYDELRARRLLLPVQGYDRQRLRDSFLESRESRVHEAIDLLAPRGTRVLAADDGVIRRLSSGDRGGVSVYQLDPAGRYGYYYAHLDRYAPLLREGQIVQRGEVIGFVGTTGNAPPTTPHLHFAIVRIDKPERWWEGKPINPYVLFSAAG